MKVFLSVLVLVFLATACNGTGPTTERQTSNVERQTLEMSTPPGFEVSSSSPTSTQTRPIPTLTFTPTTSLSPTPTPIPCDPVQSYCRETGHFFLDRPIALPGTVTVDRGYLYGTTELGTRDPHHGVEFNNASGTPVLAAADGKVIVAGDDSQAIYGTHPNSYGNLIVIEHHFPGISEPIYTLYGHLSKVEVQPGQAVHSGEEIGLVGSTGAAIGSHLHFEVREGQNNYDSNRNPVLWLKPLLDQAGQPYGGLAGRLQDSQGNAIHTDGVNIQYFPDRNGSQAAAWQVETYAPEQHPVQPDDTWQENFGLGDLRPGDYRFSLIWGGKFYERWVVVAANQLTYFVIRIDP
jgi:murein DD-endopeptidase MepM/ murein hydrolase activator NlpD